jgi:small multidrug resistance family-3 protein
MLIAKSMCYFILEALRDRRGLSDVAVASRRKKHMASYDRCCRTRSLWSYPNNATGKFGSRLRAYGGVFIILSVLWGWQIDKIQPDKLDILGGCVALAGVAIIMFVPRS